MKKNKNHLQDSHIQTQAIHGGSQPCPQTGAVSFPIYQTSTFQQISPGIHQGYEYSRTHNPTRDRLEEALSLLENGSFAVTTSSGLSAMMLIVHLLKPGSHILCGDDVYGGTYRQLTKVFGQHYQIHFCDTTQEKLLSQKIQEFRPDLIWIESPTNPLLKITPISAVRKNIDLLLKYKKISTPPLLVVDNTFMSPIFQNPLNLGADLVLHSLTKYIAGHSDCIGGAIIGRSEKLRDQLRYLLNAIGPCPAPFESWLILRSLKTLPIRMERHYKNALTLAKRLEDHPKIKRVIYPGLKSHPQYSIQKNQTSGQSGMLCVELKGNYKTTQKILNRLQFFTLAESLGGVESLIEVPSIMTHASIPKDIRESLGISDTLIRLSIGIENLEDLWFDLSRALA